MRKLHICILLTVVMITCPLLMSCDKKVGDEKKENIVQTGIVQKFSELSKIPRNNGDSMAGISRYIIRCAKQLKLTATTDKAGNIMIEKPAAPGYDKAPVTIVQTNMDMIAKASPSTIFDEQKDGITPIVNENTKTIYGKDTNLGASSGIGIATALYLMENTTVHGGLKAVFTADKEGSMRGAKNIDPEFLNGDYLINLNNTDSNIIETASAYTTTLTGTENISLRNTANKYSFVMVADEFRGGNVTPESGENQGNPILFLAEVLALAKSEGLSFELNDIESDDGLLGIPKTAKAVVSVNEYEKSRINTLFDSVKKSYLSDHKESDPNARLEIIETKVPRKAFTNNNVNSLVSFLYGMIDNGYESEKNKTGSSNLSSIYTQNNRVVCNIFARSQQKNEIDEIISNHYQIAKISDMTVKIADYTAVPDESEDTFLAEELAKIYKSLKDIAAEPDYSKSRTEQAFFHEKNNRLKTVSIGPTVKNQGDINEFVELDTVDVPAEVITAFLAGLTEK